MGSMKQLTANERVIVALDVDELTQAEEIITEVGSMVGMFKIGLQLGVSEGWGQTLQRLRELAPSTGVFADTKFKDIPQTQFQAARAITRHRPTMFNVHAGNSMEALKQAMAGAADVGDNPPQVLGVTVLTSIDDRESQELYGRSAGQAVLAFAQRALEAGLDGLVCSAQEAAQIRRESKYNDLKLVTPGIRPQWANGNDQARIMTPAEALNAGADYLVIGRPITQPPIGISRAEAVQKIIEEIS
jgi:orotidine-5'-phosphate decarboxylase